MSMTFYYDVVSAEGTITNVPEHILCKQCYKKAYRNSEVELSENRKPFANYRGEIEYEQDYKTEYLCDNGHVTLAIVNLRE